jgi:hypothetical protein
MGQKYDYQSFRPIQLKPSRSAVSVSGWADVYTICQRYNLNYIEINDTIYQGDYRRRVILIRDNINFISVPPAQPLDSDSFTEYAEQICNCLISTEYLHFTHFKYLKTSLLAQPIKKILDVFLKKDPIHCEVCWDIDEKFFDEMSELLKLSLIENNLPELFDSYNEDDFKWNRDYHYQREGGSEFRYRQYIQLLQRINNPYVQAADDESRVDRRLRRVEMVTRRDDALPNIGSVAAGNAGEFYALQIFIRRGFVAGKAPEGTSRYDLLVMSGDACTFKPIQVKTITDGRHWILSRTHEVAIENLIFCFVKFTGLDELPKLYLIPASKVSHVISMGHQIYMTLPNRLGGIRRGSSLRTLESDFSVLINNFNSPEEYLDVDQIMFIKTHSTGWLDEYENNFDLFTA